MILLGKKEKKLDQICFKNIFLFGRFSKETDNFYICKIRKGEKRGLCSNTHKIPNVGMGGFCPTPPSPPLKTSLIVVLSKVNSDYFRTFDLEECGVIEEKLFRYSDFVLLSL